MRVGLLPGVASGERSAVVMRPLSPAGKSLFAEARAAHQRGFPHLLRDPLRDLDPALAVDLCEGPVTPPELHDAEWAQVAAATHGTRHPDLVSGLIWRLACAGVTDATIPHADRALLVTRCLQAHGWAETAARHGLTGKPQALRRVRALLRSLAERHGGEALHRAAARYA